MQSTSLAVVAGTEVSQHCYVVWLGSKSQLQVLDGYLYLADLYGLWWLGWGFLGMSGTILLVLASILFYGKLVPMVFVKLVNRLNRLLHRKGRE